MSIIIAVILVIAPALIICCVVKAIQHTIIIRNAKRREDAPPWLINSIMNANGPDRKWNLK